MSSGLNYDDLPQRRHRLIEFEVGEALKALHLLLRYYLKSHNEVEKAQLAFKPYFRISQHCLNKPAYPKFSWGMLNNYLDEMEVQYKELRELDIRF